MKRQIISSLIVPFMFTLASFTKPTQNANGIKNLSYEDSINYVKHKEIQ